jgi:CHASE2 domain-containing sensor protein
MKRDDYVARNKVKYIKEKFSDKIVLIGTHAL